MESTAFHEAGHAWAYRLHNMPLRYISVRPRRTDRIGVCQPWKPRRINIGVQAFIASAGPVAQAHHEMRCDPDAANYEFDDYVTGAFLSGGDDDYERSHGMLDDRESVDLIRSEMEREWRRIERLAERLLSSGTVSGREAFEVLNRG
jgi:hypothetical protein